MKKFNLFKALNEKLREENIHLNLVCAGGYALEVLGLRATEDVDAFFRTNSKIDRLIYEVGEKYQVNNDGELWLNNSIVHLNQFPPKEAINLHYTFDHLTVYLVNEIYLIGMKAQSLREQDVQDIGKLINHFEIKDPDKLLEQLNEYNFHPDFSVILEGFGYAYGIEFLVSYYKRKEQTIDFDLDL